MGLTGNAAGWTPREEYEDERARTTHGEGVHVVVICWGCMISSNVYLRQLTGPMDPNLHESTTPPYYMQIVRRDLLFCTFGNPLSKNL
jgi:hypothetical protein